MRCGHDWVRPDDDSWWDCLKCDHRMHPSWTPETRRQFEATCSILQLKFTPADQVVSRIIDPM